MEKLVRPVVIVCLLLLSGCGGGFNCPFNPPQCCYNVLFGCGPFDIPFGCECSSYGLARLAPKRSPATFAGKQVDNVWSGSISRQRSTCPGLPKTLKGRVVIKTSGRRITVTVPGYGVLRGQRRGRVYRARGSYAPFTPTCKGEAVVTLNPLAKSRSRVKSAMSYGCGETKLCSARYVGSLERE
ncbi:MAG: hypothetical protein RL417_1283 [Pseudomonadota bacterium]